MSAVTYVMGLDLGPPGEPTGLAVIERPFSAHPHANVEYRIRHLQRFAPGTPYHLIIDLMAERTKAPPLARSPLVVDVTAVGQQILRRLHRSVRGVVPIIIGTGHAAQRVQGIGQMIPKKDLVTALQLALQARRLKVAPDLPAAELLTTELAGFRLRKVSINDADAVEWRVGRNDDLVLAVALACWYADAHPPRRREVPIVCGGDFMDRFGHNVTERFTHLFGAGW